jgi:intracellular septation protein
VSSKSNKAFFLFSFLPAIAYWYLEENYPLRIAVTGGLILAVLEIAIEKIFTKHVHALSKFNFFLILGLGGISLLGEDGLWFKLQPFFTGLVLSIYLFYKLKKSDGLFVEMLSEMHPDQKPNPVFFRRLERDLALFLLSYGFFMGAIALWGTTDQWLFFKTIGFYLCAGGFFVVELFLLKRQK